MLLLILYTDWLVLEPAGSLYFVASSILQEQKSVCFTLIVLGYEKFIKGSEWIKIFETISLKDQAYYC